MSSANNNQTGDAKRQLTGKGAAANSKQQDDYVPTTRESQVSSQIWGDDEDYDSEEGDEEFGLSMTPSASNNSGARKQQNRRGKIDQNDGVSA